MKPHTACSKIVFLRLPEVMRRTGKSRSAIYLDISQGVFLMPHPIGCRAVAWNEEDVTAWQLKQMQKA